MNKTFQWRDVLAIKDDGRPKGEITWAELNALADELGKPPETLKEAMAKVEAEQAACEAIARFMADPEGVKILAEFGMDKDGQPLPNPAH